MSLELKKGEYTNENQMCDKNIVEANTKEYMLFLFEKINSLK